MLIVLGSAFSFDSLLTTVHVLPTTKPGSIVANLTLLIDEAVLNSANFLAITNNFRQVYHNNSGWIGHCYSNNINPLFELIFSTPDLVVTDDTLIFKNSTVLSHLRMASPVQVCVSDSKRYVAVSFGLRLLSDSLYHLGDHLIKIQAALFNKTDSYYSLQYVQLTVEAGMYCDKRILFKFICMTYYMHSLCSLVSECPDSTQLYDFVHHRCLSSCSCGYTPFRSHTTAYCEAGLHTVYELEL